MARRILVVFVFPFVFSASDCHGDRGADSARGAADDPYVIESSLPTPEMVALFDDRQYEQATPKVRYALYQPTQESQRKKSPLIVWIHGHGEDERKDFGQLNYIDLAIGLPPQPQPFYILAVQCPVPLAWTDKIELADGQKGDMIDVHWRLIQQVMASYPVDSNRVYLVGISTGGHAVWELAARHPEAFAAVCPLSSARVPEMDRLAQIRGVVWTFHAVRDSVPIAGPAAAVDALIRQGGTGRLTTIDSVNHDTWRPAFNDHELLPWLLRQRRGQWVTWWPKSVRQHDFKIGFARLMDVLPAISVAAVVAGLVAAGRGEFQRQKLTRAA